MRTDTLEKHSAVYAACYSNDAFPPILAVTPFGVFYEYRVAFIEHISLS